MFVLGCEISVDGDSIVPSGVGNSVPFCGVGWDGVEVSHPFAEERERMGHGGCCLDKDAWLRFVVSHPSDKNKSVARMGHPGIVALWRLLGWGFGFPPIRDTAAKGWGTGVVAHMRELGRGLWFPTLARMKPWRRWGTHCSLVIEEWVGKSGFIPGRWAAR
jgi:hypothetical protein